LNILGVEHSYASNTSSRILLVIFLTSVLFKLGITPFHLFKIEVYKGIPYLSIFFYTTYYFVVFFIFFLFLISEFLAFFVNQYFLFLTLVLFLGTIYVSVLLFDVSFLKAFFTYSTIINTIGFLVAFVANL
jgi:NADH:ubiquinone oxidoreductase subunit 2 (subunit N)